MFRFVPFSFSDKNIRIKQRHRKIGEIKIESSKKLRYNKREQKGTHRRGFIMVLVATQVKRRRGTNDENDAFAGAEGEITVDLTNKELRVHDGSGKTGGFRIGRHTDRTNCVPEIPQDIKLELNNGTLTLKAGSKVYLATGNSSFPTQTIATDIQYTNAYSGRYVVIRNSQTSLYVSNIESCASGTIANRPTSIPNSAGLYFATDENKMYLTGDGGANWYSTTYMTLPIAIITVSGGVISSIDQVFNGVGYIGSSAFVLRGVKGLIPDGRNADGTLKNRIMTVQNVIIKTIPSNTGWHYLTINASGTNGDFATNYYTGTKSPSGATNYSRFYNTAENITYNIVSGNLNKTPQFVLNCYIDHSTSSPYKINSMKQVTTFRAVDYNDTEFIAHQAMPSDKYIDLTLGASGATYTAPADGYIILLKKGDYQQYITIDSGYDKVYADYAYNDQVIGLRISVKKGKNFSVWYSASKATQRFAFMYAQGSK